MKKRKNDKKKKSGFFADLKKVYEIDAALCKAYILRGGIAFLVAAGFFLFFAFSHTLYLCIITLFFFTGFVVGLLLQLNEIMTGKALAYTGTVIRVTGENMNLLKKGKKRIRTEAVMKDDEGRYITFYPQNRGVINIGDKVMIYAPNISVVQTDDNSYSITRYYFLKTTEIA